MEVAGPSHLRGRGTWTVNELFPAAIDRKVQVDSQGIAKEKVAPGPSFGSAHKRPLCLSIMERLMDNPMPIPSLFVV